MNLPLLPQINPKYAVKKAPAIMGIARVGLLAGSLDVESVLGFRPLPA
jgi:hypothetical protein